jgi:hypothetical protein
MSDITFTSSTGFSTATFCTQEEKKEKKRKKGNSKIISRKMDDNFKSKNIIELLFKIQNRRRFKTEEGFFRSFFSSLFRNVQYTTPLVVLFSLRR